MDTLINRQIKKDGVDNSIPANTFLQDWTISTGKGCKLPEDVKSLLKVAKRHGVCLEIAAPPLDVLLDIPVWDHLGLEPEIRKLNKSKACKCLKCRHLVQTVRDVWEIVQRKSNPMHKDKGRCSCTGCSRDQRDFGCEQTQQCVRAAEKLLNHFQRKWDPRYIPPNDGLFAEQGAATISDGVIFDLLIDDVHDLSNGFRVFMDPQGQSNMRASHRLSLDNNSDISTAWISGACINEGADNAQVGAGVWYGHGDNCNMSFRLPDTEKTTYAGEL